MYITLELLISGKMPYREMYKLNGRIWNQKFIPVFRLLSKVEYVDTFFETGELLISTLARMKEYDNPIQGDSGEGSGQYITEDEKGTVHIIGYDTFENSYVLCTTTQLNDRIVDDFNAVGAIKINDPTQFGAAIMKRIPNSIAGGEGFCDYVDYRSTWFRKGTKGNTAILKFAQDKKYAHHLVELSSGMEAFKKPLEYEYQKEYRFIWGIDRNDPDPMVVTCPEAIEYCERIDF